MNQYLKVALLSLLASVIPIAHFLANVESGDNFMQPLQTFALTMGISIIFGVAGLISNKENRREGFVSWLTISFVIIFLLTTATRIYRNVVWEKSATPSEEQYEIYNEPPRKAP